MEITNENLLQQAFKNGINLFIGAGFSILAKDCKERNLPTADALNKELQTLFKKSNNLNLSQLSSILEKSYKNEFYKYLVERFSVKYVDPLYLSLNNLNIKSIYTTNIDNLIPQIIANGNKYINDQTINGPTTDQLGINYIPLHGNVDIFPHKFVFDSISLSNIYSNTPRLWNCLSRELEVYPTLFIGYSFNDSSVIQALTSNQTFENAQKDKWILLKDANEESKELYESLGFHIIVGNLSQLLEYLKNFKADKNIKPTINKDIRDLLKNHLVPHSIYEVTRHRPIKEFYTGSSPIWCDILGNQIYKTHYLSKILNSIHDHNQGTIIIGAPVSGKSTLLMQVANELKSCGIKLYFDYLSENKAIYITKLIGKQQAVIFIDNIYESIDALPILEKSNIKIIGAERSHNYSIISHLIDNCKYTIINVTNLTDVDTQGIYNVLPPSLRTDFLNREKELDIYSKDSLFEFVIRNIKASNIKIRYQKAIQAIETNDPDLAEFLILCAYMHSCRIPLSSEMAHFYFDGFEYNDIFDLKEDASDIIHDYIPTDIDNYADMDYYYPRSVYIAEIIIQACSKESLQKVMKTVIKNVPSFIICNYKIFKKYAFDKILALKAFDKWQEGKSYYENAFLYDNRNPYVLQQGALYLSEKHHYEDAFNWIDRAITMTDDKHFSIRNSHAIILFNANIKKESNKDVRNDLDTSMHILERCMKADTRKRFHAHAYGRQAIQYYNRFQDDQAKVYLRQAEDWLNKEVDNSAWDIETRKLRDQIKDIISHL